MDAKITLVPTHSIQSEAPSQTTNVKPDDYKPYKARGKYQGFRRNNTPKQSETEPKTEQKPKEQPKPEEKVEVKPTSNVPSKPEQQPRTEKYRTFEPRNKNYNHQAQDYQEEAGTQEYENYEEGAEQDYQFTCEFPRAKDYSNIETVSQTFPHLKDVNSNSLDIEKLSDVRCFIMRSNNEDDIHKAIKYGIWTSTPKSNEFLNSIYEECTTKKIPIFLFYSVVRSGQFVAVAQLTSKVIDKSFQFWWEGDKWVNHFQVKWLFIKDIPYKHFNNLYMDDNTPVIRARDCTSVPVEITKEMLRIYKNYSPYNSIFNAFGYMDIREDQLRSYRYSMQMYQRFFNPPNASHYTAQDSTNAASYQQAPQYFKYNAFPPKPKDASTNVQGQKKVSPKKEPLHDLENCFKEFEITYNFYNDEKKKWEQDGTTMRKQIAEGKTNSNGVSSENLVSREKEIMEGLEVMESKHKAVVKAMQEYEQKITGDDVKEKLNSRLKSLTDSLEQFKEKFNSSKKDMSSLYEQIDNAKSI